MKKYILLLVTALSFAQASNQMVTFTQAQSLGFTLNSGQSHTTSNKCMTKNDALVKYNLDASAMSSYASNQLVPKSAWVNALTYYTYQISSGGCSDPVETINLYSSSPSISLYMVFYTNTSLTTTFDGFGFGYYYPNGSQLLTLDRSGVLNTITSCQQTSYPYGFSISTTQASTSCSLEITNTHYSPDGFLGVGSVLYTSANLTTNIIGSNRWFFTDSGLSFKVNDSGVIIQQYNCY